MELFDSLFDRNKNLLPKDGTVHYFGRVFDQNQSDVYYTELLNKVNWQNDQAIVFGKTVTTKRKVAWYADKPFSYTYSGITKHALVWNDVLLEIKKAIEHESEEQFNSCLLNLYHSGEEGMTWHSDSEKELKKFGAIASVSFGVERKFSFKHKQTKERLDLKLAHGSLMIMKGSTQAYWLHSLPKTRKVSLPRINLTFRTITY